MCVVSAKPVGVEGRGPHAISQIVCAQATGKSPSPSDPRMSVSGGRGGAVQICKCLLAVRLPLTANARLSRGGSNRREGGFLRLGIRCSQRNRNRQRRKGPATKPPPLALSFGVGQRACPWTCVRGGGLTGGSLTLLARDLKADALRRSTTRRRSGASAPREAISRGCASRGLPGRIVLRRSRRTSCLRSSTQTPLPNPCEANCPHPRSRDD